MNILPIKKITGTLTKVTDLTPTAREVTITLTEPLTFTAGAFVNLFLPHNEVVLRRAYSISSGDTQHLEISIAVRFNPKGEMTPLFWKSDLIGTQVEVMGPLGLNTADKMEKENVFLFGFGIGAGVMKSLAEHMVRRPHLNSLTIMTGSRDDTDIVYKDFFDKLTATNPKVSVSYVVSSPHADSPHHSGYIQDHISNLKFNDADVYICGQEVACTALHEAILAHELENCSFYIEGFH